MDGLLYKSNFLSPEEEGALIREIQMLPLASFQMKGVTSKRQVLHFGWDYNYDAWKIRPAAPLPDFLKRLREQAAGAVREAPEGFEEALINGYPPGAGIGWHRDAPMFGTPIIGISVGSPCVMKFRKKIKEGFEIVKQPLEPRSLYALSGSARSAWQHTIPPAKALRYSITFRKLARRPAADH
jgi:alkylated DNA repair protein (DNA oxidative demethylase)